MTTPTTPQRIIWFVYGCCLLVLLLTIVHMQLSFFTDSVGFSSNRDFYYHNLHPIRTMVRFGLFVTSAVGTMICVLLFGWSGTTSFLRALLVLCSACALHVVFVLVLMLVFLGSAIGRGDATLADFLFATMFLVPPLVCIFTAKRLFSVVGGRKTLVLWLPMTAIIALAAQAVFLLSDPSLTFYAGYHACCAVATLAIVTGALFHMRSVDQVN